MLGDLSRRKPVPACYQLDKAGLRHDETRIIGVARHALDPKEFAARMRARLETFVTEPLVPGVVDRRLARLHCVLINLDAVAAYTRLAEVVDQENRVLVNFFSVAPHYL